MTRKLKISILAALFAGGTVLAPAMADTEINNDAESDSTAENENVNASLNDNNNTSSSNSTSSSTATNNDNSEVCLALCGVLTGD